ncbi:ATP-binding protein [Agromyces protaetiae]|uniref:ATP-binding protein n=1 Tax=Agromyces protaetiae TaxID=2509455 RepID=A0A4P6FE77_9MICO|nr:ATP-binding protein [Agromyces protaetiae]QAY74215.1 ATP-binding protein [Agromyces protaetiae]
MTGVDDGSIDGGTVIGRRAELARLDELVTTVERGSAAVSVVSGPPGIGKTFLVEAALRARPEVRAVWATVPLGSGIPRPFDFLRLLLQAMDVPAERITESIDGFAGEQEQPEHPDALSTRVLDELDAFRGASPLALVCDNLEQADDESLRVLDGFARRLLAEPVLLVLIGRSTPGTWLRALSGAGWTIGDTRIALRGWSADTDPALAAGPAPFDAPQSMDLALADAAPPLRSDERGVLDALAVLGGGASLIDLAEVSGEPDLAGLVAGLVESGVLREGPAPGAVAFRSAVVRDILARDLPRARRRELHRRAVAVSTGEASWRHRLAASDEDPSALAAEIEAEARREAAAEPVRAARYLIWAASLGAAVERAPRLLEGVRLLALSAHEAEASRYADEIRALPSSPERSEVQALIAFGQAHPGRARDLLLEALADPRVDDRPGMRARLNVELACVATLIGLGADAVTAAEAVAASGANTVTAAEKSAALAFGAMGRALLDGPEAGLGLLRTLPENPSQCVRNDLPQLVHRGILRGLLGQLNTARADLLIASRRQSPAMGRSSDRPRTSTSRGAATSSGTGRRRCARSARASRPPSSSAEDSTGPCCTRCRRSCRRASARSRPPKAMPPKHARSRRRPTTSVRSST